MKFEKIQGFPPIANAHARVLILGTMPSVASLQQQQYYGHARNAFWPIMTEICGVSFDLAYQQRVETLLCNGIAVWDVLKVCTRKGSLDSDIKTEGMLSNDFNQFFSTYTHISRVFFNGSNAEKIYRRYVLPGLDEKYSALTYLRLPSTSPAYAAMQIEQKRAAWNVINLYL